MSDTPKPPALPPVKDAVPDGKEDKPVHRTLTLGQQIFIWSMVLIVGVIFGVGASFSLVFAQADQIGGVSQAEVIQRMRVAERIERVLNPDGQYPLYIRYGREVQGYADDLRLVRIAAERGLLPQGRALDRIEADFLAKPLPGSKDRTNLDALREHAGGAHEVTKPELRRFLAERAALQMLGLRSTVAPAMPRSLAGEVAGAFGDRAEVAVVTIDGKRLLPTVAPDDPEIPTLYERLRGNKELAHLFFRPTGATVQVAVADRDLLGKPLEISEADQLAWYEANKAERFPGGDPDPKDPKKTQPKPFAAVKAEVEAALRAERGTAAAQKAIAPFNAAAEALENDKDPARFRAAAEEAGLRVEELTIEDRTPGTLDLGKLGTVSDVLRLFNREHETGLLSQPLVTSQGHWVILRLAARRDPGFVELDTVRPQVAKMLAARRAHAELVKQAGELRARLAAQGGNALSAWAASDEGKAWGATINVRTMSLLTPVRAPGAGIDDPAGEAQLIAALAMPPHPIALASMGRNPGQEAPSLMLVQVVGSKPMPKDTLDAAMLALRLREQFSGYGFALLARELKLATGS